MYTSNSIILRNMTEIIMESESPVTTCTSIHEALPHIFYPEVSIAELNSIRDKIESMPKFSQIEILRILSKSNNVTLNENKYGVHINLTDVDKTIIHEIKNYINYVNAQEINLIEIENQKEQFINIYFSKDNKDTE